MESFQNPSFKYHHLDHDSPWPVGGKHEPISKGYDEALVERSEVQKGMMDHSRRKQIHCTLSSHDI